MTWRTVFWVWLAWATFGALHALQQYSDIMKYNAKIDFGYAELGFLILSYSLWSIITLLLLRVMRSFTYPFAYRSLISLFFCGWLIWIPIFFSIDQIISIWIKGQTLDVWLPALLNTSAAVIFFYSVMFGQTFAVCLGLVLADKTKHTQEKNAELNQQQTELALQLTEQKMQLMQSQLSPHFLFNCMGGISSLARQGQQTQLIEAIARIGDLLRFTVENASSKTITLDEELSFAKNYVSLQKLRFEDRFTCEFNANELNSDVMCPPFTLQLLLENVFRHGVEATEDAIKIVVNIQQNQHNVTIRVGNSLTPLSTNTRSMGIGLDNLQSRLAHIYHDKFLFSVNKNQTQFDAHLTIPNKVNA